MSGTVLSPLFTESDQCALHFDFQNLKICSAAVALLQNFCNKALRFRIFFTVVKSWNSLQTNFHIVIHKTTIFDGLFNLWTNSHFDFFTGLFDLIAKYKEALSNREELRIPEEAAKSALCACYFGLLWDLQYIQSTIERETTASAVLTLRQKFDR